LNFDFHPRAVRQYLDEAGFIIEKQLTVSHLRSGFLKHFLPTGFLVKLDSMLQWTGSFIQVSPSIFSRCLQKSDEPPADERTLFQCPICQTLLQGIDQDLTCGGCSTTWKYQEGIYDFRIPGAKPA